MGRMIFYIDTCNFLSLLNALTLSAINILQENVASLVNYIDKHRLTGLIMDVVIGERHSSAILIFDHLLQRGRSV